MADYTYEQLKDRTVADLREIAKGIEHDSLQGYSTMHKDHLLPALCKALGIEAHHVAQGAKKANIKSTIHNLRSRRDEKQKAGQLADLPAIRGQIHALKRTLRRMAT